MEVEFPIASRDGKISSAKNSISASCRIWANVADGIERLKKTGQVVGAGHHRGQERGESSNEMVPDTQQDDCTTEAGDSHSFVI